MKKTDELDQYREQLANYMKSCKCGLFATPANIEDAYKQYNGHEKVIAMTAAMMAINSLLDILAEDILNP